MKHFGSYRTFGNPEDPRDLGVRIPFDIEQDDGSTTTLRQFRERGAQPIAQLIANCHRIRPRAAADQRRVERLGAPDRLGPPPPPPSPLPSLPANLPAVLCVWETARIKTS